MYRLIVLMLIACAPAFAQTFNQTCDSPSFPGDKATPIDSACSVEGNGGKEANQNTAKNNFCAHGSDPETIGFDKLTQLQKDVQDDGSIVFGNRDSDNPGPQVDRAKLQEMGEGKLVTLKGFVKIARQEGAESVNCGKNIKDLTRNHDIHISLVPTRQEANECNGVVVEMSPHHRPAQWNKTNVQKLARFKGPVRVTGQLMFDSSHSPCDGGTPVSGDPARISLWEVHPIYKFEVCTADCDGDGQWEDLVDWLNDNPTHKGGN